MQVICENPRIIINPLAQELISQHCNYYIKGKKFSFTHGHKKILYNFDFKHISPFRNQITHEDLQDCYVVDRSTGDTYPLYLEVRCGRCALCKASKMNSFVHRCLIESLNYSCKPIFITLTYEKKPEQGVSVRDIQLFLKRLRINLFRHGYRQKIRYAVVSEYGRRTHRPHYHCIFWNLRQTNILDIRQIAEIVKTSWSLGFIQWRFIDPSDDKGFFYTSKYLRKDCVVPEGCNPTFLLSSRRGGGIGSSIPREVLCSVRRDFNIAPQFHNTFVGKSQSFQLNSYYLNKLFPSFSRSLPLKLKSNVREYLFCYSILKHHYHYETEKFDKEAEQISNFFGQYFYCPILEHSEVKTGVVYSPTFCFRQISLLQPCIEQALNFGSCFYDKAKKIQSRRNYFLFKLFQNSRDVDIDFRGYVIRRSFSLAQEREIF